MSTTENRKQEIIRISARLFKERGYSAVSMRDLAKEMGIKAASLYNHINSKEDILSDIIITIALDFTNGMTSIISSKTTSLNKLRDIIFQHVEITSNNPDGMSSLNNDWMHLVKNKAYYLELRRSYEENFRNIIHQGILEKEIKQVDVDVTLFSILSTLRSLYLWVPKKEDMDKEALASSLSDILLNGINK